MDRSEPPGSFGFDRNRVHVDIRQMDSERFPCGCLGEYGHGSRPFTASLEGRPGGQPFSLIHRWERGLRYRRLPNSAAPPKRARLLYRGTLLILSFARRSSASTGSRFSFKASFRSIISAAFDISF